MLGYMARRPCSMHRWTSSPLSYFSFPYHVTMHMYAAVHKHGINTRHTMTMMGVCTPDANGSPRDKLPLQPHICMDDARPVTTGCVWPTRTTTQMPCRYLIPFFFFSYIHSQPLFGRRLWNEHVNGRMCTMTTMTKIQQPCARVSMWRKPHTYVPPPSFFLLPSPLPISCECHANATMHWRMGTHCVRRLLPHLSYHCISLWGRVVYCNMSSPAEYSFSQILCPPLSRPHTHAKAQATAHLCIHISCFDIV